MVRSRLSGRRREPRKAFWRLAPSPTRAISRPMARKHVNLGRAPAKADLPDKVCAACRRPFSWRRKWAKDWESVRYCSDRCRDAR